MIAALLRRRPPNRPGATPMNDDNRPVDEPQPHPAWDVASVVQVPNDAPPPAGVSGVERAPASLRSRSRASIAPRASGTAAVRAGIVVGSALVVALGAAVVMAASPTTSGSSAPSAQASTAPRSSNDPGGSGPPAGARPRAGNGLFGGLHPFR